MITKINVETGQTVSPQLAGATVMDDSGEKVEIDVYKRQAFVLSLSF